MVINMVYRQDEICVSCGRYMGKSEDMICKYCKEENSPKKMNSVNACIEACDYANFTFCIRKEQKLYL